MGKPFLDQATLKAMLHYDPDTGIWTWLHRPEMRPQWNSRYAGKRAGYARIATGGRLYWSVRIHDWPFHSNRIAWLYMTGDWPADLVDHKDNDGLNDRWSNLRSATQRQNGANSAPKKNNKSGFKGVRKAGNRYEANIYDGQRQRYLGSFVSPELAHEAYCRAAQELFGEFARMA